MYFIILILLLIAVYKFEYRKIPLFDKTCYQIFLFLLIIVAGLRYRIGVDTVAYSEEFAFYPTLDNLRIEDFQQYGTNLLWLILNSVCKTVYNDFVLVQLVHAAVVNIVIFWFIKRYSPRPFFSILLYYIFIWWSFCFEVMRESIAVAIYLYALDAILLKKNYILFYIRAWLAIFVHSFGVVILLFPFIQFLKLRKITIIIVAAILYVVTFHLNDYLELFFFVFDDTTTTKLDYYLNSEIYGSSMLSIMGFFAYLLGNILPIILIIYIISKQNNNDKYKLFIPYILIYIVILFLRFKISIFYRFLNYFEIVLIISMAQVFDINLNSRKNIRCYLGYFSIIMIIALKVYGFYRPAVLGYDKIKYYQRYYPYNSIFEKKYNPDTEWIFQQKGH